MFPLKEKSFIMSTRNPEKYKVQHTLNERLRKSPIIYMQNLFKQIFIENKGKNKQLVQKYKENQENASKINQIRVNFCACTVASEL